MYACVCIRGRSQQSLGYAARILACVAQGFGSKSPSSYPSNHIWGLKILLCSVCMTSKTERKAKFGDWKEKKNVVSLFVSLYLLCNVQYVLCLDPLLALAWIHHIWSILVYVCSLLQTQPSFPKGIIKISSHLNKGRWFSSTLQTPTSNMWFRRAVGRESWHCYLPCAVEKGTNDKSLNQKNTCQNVTGFPSKVYINNFPICCF